MNLLRSTAIGMGNRTQRRARRATAVARPKNSTGTYHKIVIEYRKNRCACSWTGDAMYLDETTAAVVLLGYDTGVELRRIRG